MKRSVIAALCVTLAAAITFPAKSDTWRTVENPEQTLFIDQANPWGFNRPDWLRVRVDDLYNGRAEWVRWGTVASGRPTARLNYQEGKRFNYLGSPLDRFDNWFKRVDTQRSPNVVPIETKFGTADTVEFSIFYKGFNRSCQFFTFLVKDNTVIFNGHICDEEGGRTAVSKVGIFLNSIDIE